MLVQQANTTNQAQAATAQQGVTFTDKPASQQPVQQPASQAVAKPVAESAAPSQAVQQKVVAPQKQQLATAPAAQNNNNKQADFNITYKTNNGQTVGNVKKTDQMSNEGNLVKSNMPKGYVETGQTVQTNYPAQGNPQVVVNVTVRKDGIHATIKYVDKKTGKVVATAQANIAEGGQIPVSQDCPKGYTIDPSYKPQSNIPVDANGNCNVTIPVDQANAAASQAGSAAKGSTANKPAAGKTSASAANKGSQAKGSQASSAAKGSTSANKPAAGKGSASTANKGSQAKGSQVGSAAKGSASVAGQSQGKASATPGQSREPASNPNDVQHGGNTPASAAKGSTSANKPAASVGNKASQAKGSQAGGHTASAGKASAGKGSVSASASAGKTSTTPTNKTSQGSAAVKGSVSASKTQAQSQSANGSAAKGSVSVNQSSAASQSGKGNQWQSQGQHVNVIKHPAKVVKASAPVAQLAAKRVASAPAEETTAPVVEQASAPVETAAPAAQQTTAAPAAKTATSSAVQSSSSSSNSMPNTGMNNEVAAELGMVGAGLVLGIVAKRSKKERK